MVTRTVGDLQALTSPAIAALRASKDPRAESVLALFEYAWEPYQGMNVAAATPARDLGPQTRDELCRALTAAYELTKAPSINSAAMVVLGIEQSASPAIKPPPMIWWAVGAVGLLALIAIYKASSSSRT